jgi:hypothetical protein
MQSDRMKPCWFVATPVATLGGAATASPLNASLLAALPTIRKAVF